MTIGVQKRSSRSGAPTEVPVTVIRPPKGWAPFNFGEIWASRELIYFMTWRDIKVRYKQTVIGFLWVILQPLLMTLIFTLFFGMLGRIPTDGAPYAVFYYSALLPWNLFSSGVTKGSNSLISDAALIRKVYFPRLISPLAAILSPLVDFFFSFLVLIGVMLVYHYVPLLQMLTMIPLLLLLLFFALGIGLWFSAINVEYRDVNYIVPFLVQLLFFASPIIYPSSYVPARFQLAYGLMNPMSGIISGFRWAVLGTSPPDATSLIGSTTIIVVVLFTGILYFRFKERAFADVV